MPGGINAAVRELGIERTEAQRSVKIASIAPEAREAADAAGLNTQSARLEIAKAADQVAKVHEIAERSTAQLEPLKRRKLAQNEPVSAQLEPKLSSRGRAGEGRPGSGVGAADG